MEHLIPGLKAGLNVAEDIAVMAGTNAFKTNPAPSATSFDLDMLNQHGTIEHDNSLSRGDYFFGDNHSFNETIYAETSVWFHDPIISLPQAVLALQSRIETSRKTNPHFFFDLDGSTATTASYLSVFGDTLKGEARRDWVNYFFRKSTPTSASILDYQLSPLFFYSLFLSAINTPATEHERLPIELGWAPAKLEFNMTLLLSLATRIADMLPADLVTVSVKGPVSEDRSHWLGGIGSNANQQQEPLRIQ